MTDEGLMLRGPTLNGNGWSPFLNLSAQVISFGALTAAHDS